MKLRSTVAAGITALALTAAPAVATAATPDASHGAAVQVARSSANSPTGAVTAYARALGNAKGAAACALMTKGYQQKAIKAAVKAGAPSGISCAKVLTAVGKQVKANGGVPAYKLKIEKRTATKAVVRLTYKSNSISGTYTTLRVHGKWLISASTVDA